GWRGNSKTAASGCAVYAMEAWTNSFATWRRDFLAKREGGLDVALEIEEGRKLLTELKLRNNEQTRLLRDICGRSDLQGNPAALLSDELAAAASKGQQSDLTRSARYPLVVDRPLAPA